MDLLGISVDAFSSSSRRSVYLNASRNCRTWCHLSDKILGRWECHGLFPNWLLNCFLLNNLMEICVHVKQVLQVNCTCPVWASRSGQLGSTYTLHWTTGISLCFLTFIFPASTQIRMVILSTCQSGEFFYFHISNGVSAVNLLLLHSCHPKSNKQADFPHPFFMNYAFFPPFVLAKLREHFLRNRVVCVCVCGGRRQGVGCRLESLAWNHLLQGRPSWEFVISQARRHATWCCLWFISSYMWRLSVCVARLAGWLLLYDYDATPLIILSCGLEDQMCLNLKKKISFFKKIFLGRFRSFLRIVRLINVYM